MSAYMTTTMWQNAAAPTFTPTRPARSPLLQRRCACGGVPGPDGECAACRAKRLARQHHAHEQDTPAAAPPIVHDVLRAPGRPLDPAARAVMEPRFGHDFSRVRVHTDARAAASARAVDALAYTVERDIVFGAGQYRPASATGQRLLAHELTHVLQQDRGERRIRRAPIEHGVAADPIAVTPAAGPMLSRDIPFPGVISRCRSMGVPCPVPQLFNGQLCRLADCYRARTANLPFAISPGVCIYRCEDGSTCSCVLVGTSSSAVCTFRFCSSSPVSSAPADLERFASDAVDAAARESAGQPSPPGEEPVAQA